MPTYDYQCTACSTLFEDFCLIADRDGARGCPHCGVTAQHERPLINVPRIEGDLTDWSNETDQKTGLHGRYCPQAAKFPGDKRAVFKDRNSFVEWGKRKGYTVSKD